MFSCFMLSSFYFDCCAQIHVSMYSNATQATQTRFKQRYYYIPFNLYVCVYVRVVSV